VIIIDYIIAENKTKNIFFSYKIIENYDTIENMIDRPPGKAQEKQTARDFFSPDFYKDLVFLEM